MNTLSNPQQPPAAQPPAAQSPAAQPPRRAVLGMAALACVAALWTPARGFAAPAGASEAEFTAAQQRFLLASEGDGASVEPAAQAFATLLARHPGDAVLMAYAGAAVALRAREAWLPWKKMSLAEDGLARLDKALALLTPADDAPRYRGVSASLETRFVASGTFLALPSMFNRRDRGDRLLQSLLTSPLFEGSPVGFKAAVWLRAGSHAGKDHPDEARRLLRLAADSATPSAAAARAKLMELGL